MPSLRPDKYFIIPVFLPHYGCPHQCAFCNQKTITGTKHDVLSPEKLRLQINNFLKFKGQKAFEVQIAFYGGNFLGTEESYMKMLLNEAAKFIKNGSVDSIRFSTRPDTIVKHRLDLLKDYPVSTIEIGVQSMNDRVLLLSNRGHTADDSKKAVTLLKERDYLVGLQMMVGLPGDDEPTSLATGDAIADLAPDFVRIYPTVVIAGSPLAKWYKQGTYKPLSIDKSVSVVKKLYLLFKEKNIPVIRMGLQAGKELDQGTSVLAGPYHPAFGHMVFSEIFLDMAVKALKAETSLNKTVTINVHPKNISKMRGLKNKNLNILKNNFNLHQINIIPDQTMEKDRLSVSC